MDSTTSVWSPFGVSRGYSQINNRPSEKYRPLRNQSSKNGLAAAGLEALREELRDGVSAVGVEQVAAYGPDKAAVGGLVVSKRLG